jgi:periplasmic protein CpxP/Spy
MRSVTLIAAIASLTAGAAFAQYDAKQPASPPAAQTKPATPSAGAPSTANAGAVATETQAKARIEAQGYTNVSELKKDAQGLWSAKAMKDGKSVQLSLDTQGQVAVQN